MRLTWVWNKKKTFAVNLAAFYVLEETLWLPIYQHFGWVDSASVSNPRVIETKMHDYNSNLSNANANYSSNLNGLK